MASTVNEVMTRDPATVEADTPVIEAARLMRETDAGNVVVLDNGQVSGIVTDRDIVIRLVAEDKPYDTPVREVCSTDPQTLGPDSSIEQAIQIMRTHAIRRIPVVENGRAVGILSIGDLAIERDEDSALADISSAEPDE